MSYVIRHMSYVIRHTSYVICHIFHDDHCSFFCFANSFDRLNEGLKILFTVLAIDFFTVPAIKFFLEVFYCPGNWIFFRIFCVQSKFAHTHRFYVCHFFGAKKFKRNLIHCRLIWSSLQFSLEDIHFYADWAFWLSSFPAMCWSFTYWNNCTILQWETRFITFTLKKKHVLSHQIQWVTIFITLKSCN